MEYTVRKYSGDELVKATALDDWSPFPHNAFHIWQQTTVGVTSKGDIVLNGHSFLVDQWWKDPDLIQKNLVEAITHPEESNDRPPLVHHEQRN